MSRQNPTLSPEQAEIVRWVASLGAITAEALALRYEVTLACARARLAVAHRRGLVSRACPLAGRPSLFTLTRAGLRASDMSDIQACRVSASNANHLIVCAKAAAALERCYPCNRVVGERELRRDEREHGRALASARIAGLAVGEQWLHRPDLVLWPDASEGALPVPVEVELTVKAPRRLLAICRAWARCRTIAGVLYLATPPVERALLRAVGEAGAVERIAVVGLDALPGMEVVAAGSASSVR
jgi:hypothetical protein